MKKYKQIKAKILKIILKTNQRQYFNYLDRPLSTVLIFIFCNYGFSQEINLSGTITDTLNNPLQNPNVLAIQATRGNSTK